MNMQKIAIITDSGSDVPKEYKEKYPVYTLPLSIIYGEKVYKDNVDITPEEVYGRMPGEVPTTSLPTGEEILGVFEQIKKDGFEKVLGVTISSGLSGTHNFLKVIAEDFEGLETFVVDTKNIGISSGLVAIEAMKNIDKGMSWEELKAVTEKGASKSKIFFCIKTLEYLQKGGRIGLVSSLVGNALNLKPIITCNKDGIYDTIAKCVGRRRNLQKAVELVLEEAAKHKKCRIAVAHGGGLEEAEQIVSHLKEDVKNCDEFLFGNISPALGVHTGPGLIGIAIYNLDD